MTDILELPKEKQSIGYGTPELVRKYAYLKQIQQGLLRDSRNDIHFTSDENDFTLEWWDKKDSLCSITLWESGKITVLRGKQGKTLVREKYVSFDTFHQKWPELLLT